MKNFKTSGVPAKILLGDFRMKRQEPYCMGGTCWVSKCVVDTEQCDDKDLEGNSSEEL
jgi:hypothetical protein